MEFTTQAGPACLAAFIGACIASAELITSKYPNTFFLLKKSIFIYLYALVYGVIGFIVMFFLSPLAQLDSIKFEGQFVSSPWIQAIAIGFTIKGVLHIRFFNVSYSAGQTFPVGFETFVLLFEPWLLRKIVLDHYNASMEFFNTRAKQHSQLEEVKQTIKQNIPRGFSKQERVAFSADIDTAETVSEAMESYLTFVGTRAFNRVFPQT